MRTTIRRTEKLQIFKTKKIWQIFLKFKNPPCGYQDRKIWIMSIQHISSQLRNVLLIPYNFNIFQLHNFTRKNQHEKMGLKQSFQFSLFYKTVENEDEHQHSICAVYTIQVDFEATGKTGIC